MASSSAAKSSGLVPLRSQISQAPRFSTISLTWGEGGLTGAKGVVAA
jgi:hypothetical protein